MTEYLNLQRTVSFHLSSTEWVGWWSFLTIAGLCAVHVSVLPSSVDVGLKVATLVVTVPPPVPSSSAVEAMDCWVMAVPWTWECPRCQDMTAAGLDPFERHITLLVFPANNSLLVVVIFTLTGFTVKQYFRLCLDGNYIGCKTYRGNRIHVRFRITRCERGLSESYPPSSNSWLNA